MKRHVCRHAGAAIRVQRGSRFQRKRVVNIRKTASSTRAPRQRHRAGWFKRVHRRGEKQLRPSSDAGPPPQGFPGTGPPRLAVARRWPWFPCRISWAGLRARINTPGRMRGNWRWRMTPALSQRCRSATRDLTRISGRLSTSCLRAVFYMCGRCGSSLGQQPFRIIPNHLGNGHGILQDSLRQRPG